MRLRAAIAMAAMIAAGGSSFVVPASAEEAHLKSHKDIVSYSIGVETARNLQKGGIEIDMDQVIRGMKDALGNKVELPESVVRQTMKEVQSELHRNLAMARKSKPKAAASDKPQN